ncbi:SCP2 domain-containing protein [Caviibacterium pharyngocola]|uniref:Ubiquinone biosynthesis accessory factor UbiJ n=2 Tax=Caviibacterium pharyngocola TaxID=28159 RepID=A0A2M8RXV2_9PAST|nr:SCP2 domain-containing protein [Caviibacterium pharyngocola]
MLPQLFNAGLETLFNRLLQHTAHTEPYLRKLNGKVLALRPQQIDFPVYLAFSAQRVDVLHRYEGKPDCEVSVALSLLLKMPKKSQLSEYINDQSIRLQGDLQVLQDFVALAEFVEKDPAELLSPYTGDVIAQSVVTFLHNFAQTAKYHLLQSRTYWGERLTEEYELVAPALAIADFCRQVETLEKQTALFEQKLNHFQAQ